ncbi:hypothetical protein [Streptomyces massasporeus]|uniref:hypothetical protein n=1 Tax=Streptomyces massasporeus TaxID=67324 RepID=UPI003656F3AC
MTDAALRPESQVELFTPAGRRVVLDFLFRHEGLAVEIEGYAHHGTREAHRRDVFRFNQVLQCPEARGLLRFTAQDVFHHPDRMISEIRAALLASRWREWSGWAGSSRACPGSGRWLEPERSSTA